MRAGFVYIMGNMSGSSLYVGVTSDLEVRVLQHKLGIGSKFTKKYNCSVLLYFEELPEIGMAIEREKQLKNWHRGWKGNLIRENNPFYEDLSSDWYNDKDFSQGGC